jgi:Putative phage tail protein
MQKQVKIIMSGNPLQSTDRKIYAIALGKRCRVDKVLRENKLLLPQSKILLNGIPLTNKSIKSSWLKNNDTVTIFPVAAEPATVAAIITALETIAINYAISYAVGYLVRKFSDKPTGTVVENKGEDGYSLTGGSNQARPYQPLPLCLGEHRMFPDYASRFNVDYVDDVSTAIEILYLQHTYSAYFGINFRLNPSAATQASGAGWETYDAVERIPTKTNLQPWVLRDMSAYGLPANPPWGTPGGVYYYGDNIPSHVHFNAPNTSLAIDIDYPDTIIARWEAPVLGKVWQDSPATNITSVFAIDRASPAFVERRGDGYNPFMDAVRPWKTYGIKWTSLKFGQLSNNLDVADIATLGRSNFEKSQRLTNIFNYGFGDLSFVEHSIGTSPVAEHYLADALINKQVYGTAKNDFHNNWSYAPATYGSLQPPTNSEFIDGGALSKYSGKDGAWVSRQTERKKATYLELDFSGRLFYQSDSGPSLATQTFEIQYKLTSSNTWLAVPLSPYTIYNADTNTVRETIGWDVASGHYAVRVRSLTDVSIDSRLAMEIQLDGHKAYGQDDSDYFGTTRLAVVIGASKRLNGALNRWSSLVAAKCWVHNGLGAITAPPESTDNNWQWEYTKNPAWWFIYIVVGGYLNKSTVDSSAVFSGKHWRAGKLNNQETGALLFGGGLDYTNLDFDSLKAWANYCTAQGLTFSTVIDSQRPLLDVLYDIARIGRATIIWPNGKLGVSFKTVNDNVVQLFTMGNIVGDFAIAYNTEKREDEIVATYIDKDDNYAAKQVRALLPGVVTPTLEASVSLPSAMSKAQAQREANILAAEQYYYNRTISWKADVDGLVCAKWDVVAVAHDLLNDTQSGRIKKFIATPSGDITAVVLDQDIYLAPDKLYSIAIRLKDRRFARTLLLSPNSARQTGLIKSGTELVCRTPFNLQDTGAPSILDDVGSPNLFNVGPNASFPEDFLYVVSGNPVTEPLQDNAPYINSIKLRVIAVEPLEDNYVKITAQDELTADVLAWEYGAGILPAVADTKLLARCFNAYVENRHSGKYLVWESENAIGAFVNINNNGLSGVTKISGNEMLLPPYASGAAVLFVVVPTNFISNDVSIEQAILSHTF